MILTSVLDFTQQQSLFPLLLSQHPMIFPFLKVALQVIGTTDNQNHLTL